MGSRGPLPDPRSQRSQRKPQHTRRQAIPRIPRAVVGPARMPRSLSTEARAYWTRLAPELKRLGTLDALSAPLFAGWCETRATIDAMRAQLDADGMVLISPRGKQVPHPLVGPLARYEAQALTLAKAFGMTPASRQRLPPPADDAPDTAAVFLFGARTPPTGA